MSYAGFKESLSSGPFSLEFFSPPPGPLLERVRDTDCHCWAIVGVQIFLSISTDKIIKKGNSALSHLLPAGKGIKNVIVCPLQATSGGKDCAFLGLSPVAE